MKWFKSFIILFLLPVATLVAQQTALTPLDVARLHAVGGVTLSDDGTYAAYTLRVYPDPREENAPARSEIHLLDLSAEETRPFVTRGSASQVAFRPQHRSVTFLSRLEGDRKTKLYEIPLAGGEAAPLYEFETSISAYEWAPDGQRLVFIAAEAKEEEADKEELPYEPEVYEENLSYSRGYVVDLENGKREQIGLSGHLTDAHWSPDGQLLAVTTAPSPMVDDYYMKRRIAIMDAGRLQTEKASVDHAAKLGQLAWSPDSRHLAFIAGAHLNDPIDGRLFVVPAAGGEPTDLQPGFEGKFESIAWADDNTIEFIASKGVWSMMGRIDTDGSNSETVVDTGGPILTAFDCEADRCVFVAETPQHPGELYLMNEEDAAPRRVSDHNPWLAGIALGEQEPFTYQARDGLEIEGILIRPLDYREEQRYPLVTVVHGGPEAHYSNGWLTGYSSPGQMAAAKGMAVFYPNYRGSTGRGLAFAMSSQGDLAGKEFDDIVDGVDYLIEQGLAAGDKVGVTGGSYGGYATGWLSTKYTDRFAAGVMFVGISDNISKWGTSDIPEELYLVHARMRIWEDYEFFLKRSPIYYAGETKTPLLIMAGKEDTRVHPSQSIELYRHVKTRTDTPVRLVLYPGEGHGNRNATARYDYNLRMMGWFEKYLKGDEAQP